MTPALIVLLTLLAALLALAVGFWLGIQASAVGIWDGAFLPAVMESYP